MKKVHTDLEPFTRWVRAIDPAHRHLHKISEVRRDRPFPPMVINDRDDSLMVLITDGTGQPIRFPCATPGKDEIVYIDTLETTAAQYVRFLNSVGGNKEDGGVPWLKVDEFTDLKMKDGGLFAAKEKYRQNAITNVNWFGAVAYCRWAGKELPRQDEWCQAAGPTGEGSHPWGTGFDHPEKLCNCAHVTEYHGYNAPGGQFKADLSRVGCFDMAGNVAEWCEDYFAKGDPSKRVVCGGSFNDKDPAMFEITSRRGVDQVTHVHWVGFRGVVRLPVDKLPQ